MRTARSKSPRRKTDVPPEELIARIAGIRQDYFISRSTPGDGAMVDDEATLEIDAVIEEMSPRHRKNLGGSISIRLLNAQRYPRNSTSDSSFFGSVSLRGRKRSALAYLPTEPFWQLPKLIERGAKVIELRFTCLAQGSGDLLSVFIGRSEESTDSNSK